MSGLVAGFGAAAAPNGLGASGLSQIATPLTVIHHGLATGLGDGLAFSHVNACATLLAVAAIAALWTAVESPATSGRVPGRKLLTGLGWGLLLATGPLVSVVLAVGLFNAGPSSARWLIVVGLIGFSGISMITLALGWDMLARTGVARKVTLVMGDSWDRLEIGTYRAPGYDPTFVVAGAAGIDERRGLFTRRLRGCKIWGIVASDDVGPGNAELRRGCRDAGVRLLANEEFRELWSRQVDIDRLQPDAFSALQGVEDSALRRLTRRALDITLSVLLLICSFPLALLTAMLIKLDSHGPVFYRQERVGLHGRPFQLLKFRSMQADAEADSGPQWAHLADPRVTRVGVLLRRTRIDELPQLWNVLRGEMCMIGPRPERPYFVAQLAAELPCYHARSLVKPGITGWAQVNYRYGASVEDARVKLGYDLYYVKHRSVLLDLSILAATVRVVLFREGSR
ncbi:MAG: exopolysaccharide biosynthesis polyprenyl glycosylphosphotransferase [Acetobacteraceae bacterium]